MVKERLKQYLKTKHLSIRGFEQLCGIGQSVLAKITESTSEDTLRKIEENSDLNLEWLLTGKGNMLEPNRRLGVTRPLNIDGSQANGTDSVAIRDVKLEFTEQIPPQNKTNPPTKKRQPSLSELQKEIARLNGIIERQKLEIAKLQGKVEQQNETIKLFVRK